jgi:hypothetical protein
MYIPIILQHNGLNPYIVRSPIISIKVTKPREYWEGGCGMNEVNRFFQKFLRFFENGHFKNVHFWKKASES